MFQPGWEARRELPPGTWGKSETHPPGPFPGKKRKRTVAPIYSFKPAFTG